MTDATPQNNETPEENTESTTEKRSGFAGAFDTFFDHQRRAFEESGKAIDALFPEGFKEHSAAARDEFRKGLKVLVDAAIDELEGATKGSDPDAKPESDDEDGPPPSTTGRTKVKVQVE